MKKTHYIIISKTFLKGHPRAGEPTGFKEKILRGEKIHTLRSNYEYWKKRIDQVNAGEFLLSLREWKGAPYNSDQVEFLSLGEGIGIQKTSVQNKIFTHLGKEYTCPDIIIEKQSTIDFALFMGNDGFEDLADFSAWFKKSVIDGALIHFTTNFRY